MNAAYVEGWLGARPEYDGEKGKTVQPETREQALGLARRPVQRPEVEICEHLKIAAETFGWVQPMPMSDPHPIPFAAILPAMQVNGSPITTWGEADIVARMCSAFAAGRQDGKDPMSKEPWRR